MGERRDAASRRSTSHSAVAPRPGARGGERGEERASERERRGGKLRVENRTVQSQPRSGAVRDTTTTTSGRRTPSRTDRAQHRSLPPLRVRSRVRCPVRVAQRKKAEARRRVSVCVCVRLKLNFDRPPGQTEGPFRLAGTRCLLLRPSLRAISIPDSPPSRGRECGTSARHGSSPWYDVRILYRGRREERAREREKDDDDDDDARAARVVTATARCAVVGSIINRGGRVWKRNELVRAKFS